MGAGIERDDDKETERETDRLQGLGCGDRRPVSVHSLGPGAAPERKGLGASVQFSACTQFRFWLSIWQVAEPGPVNCAAAKRAFVSATAAPNRSPESGQNAGSDAGKYRAAFCAEHAHSCTALWVLYSGIGIDSVHYAGKRIAQQGAFRASERLAQ